jgi:hypothetical protein
VLADKRSVLPVALAEGIQSPVAMHVIADEAAAPREGEAHRLPFAEQVPLAVEAVVDKEVDRSQRSNERSQPVAAPRRADLSSVLAAAR